jgi:hypothetical protein
VSRRPTRGVWVAWTFAFVGGLAVLGAVVLLLGDPCVDASDAVRTAACDGSRMAMLSVLALGGTVLAVIGGGIATVLSLRRGRG